MDTTLPSSQQRPTQQPVAQPATPQTNDAVEEKKPEGQTQISAPNKEFGPMAASSAPSEQGGQVESDDEDEIKAAQQEVLLGQKVSPAKEVPVSKELEEVGVEQGADTEQEIPMVVQRAGMRATSADSAIPVSATASVKLPITYTHAQQLDKQSKIKESIKWLSRFIVRQWKRLQSLEANNDNKKGDL